MNNIVTPTTSAAPAGWYNDPIGIPQLRWWNGIGWTNHVQEHGADFQSWGAQLATASVA